MSAATLSDEPYNFTASDKGLSCRSCSFEQMEQVIQDEHPFRIIDRNLDGIPDRGGRGPSITHNFVLHFFDLERDNFVRYQVLYKPFQGVLEYTRITEIAEQKENFNVLKSYILGYQNMIRTTVNNFYTTNPIRSYNANKSVVGGEESQCASDSTPYSATDSLFDTVSGAYDQDTLIDLQRIIQDEDNRWHQNNTLFQRLNSTSLPLGLNGSRIADQHEVPMTVPFPDGIAVYAIRGPMDNSENVFTLRLDSSYFHGQHNVAHLNGTIESNVTLSLANFFEQTPSGKFTLSNSVPLVIDPCFFRHLEEALETMGIEIQDGDGNTSEGAFNGSGTYLSQQCAHISSTTHSTNTLFVPVTQPCNNPSKPTSVCISVDYMPISVFVTREELYEFCGRRQ